MVLTELQYCILNFLEKSRSLSLPKADVDT